MIESRPNKPVTDKKHIGASVEISVVPKHLVRRLIHLNQTNQSQEGGKQNEQNEHNGNDHQGVAGYCIFY